MITAQELARTAGVRHAFFTRQGGVSEGVYASLNCGFGSNDDPGRVAENRARVTARLGLAAETLVTAYQVHSAEVVSVAESWPPARAPKADGMVTRTRGLALGILTADCVPVLLVDAAAGVIGAAHAGWRGTVGGIIEATARAMETLGARLAATIAVIGPCIQQASYEVGDDLRAAVLGADRTATDLFRPGDAGGKFLFDLPGFVARRLERLNLGTIGRIAADTCADEARFFSYRRATKRGETDYGRELSVIALA